MNAVASAIFAAQPITDDPLRKLSLPECEDGSNKGQAPTDCPIVPLGFVAGKYYFLSPDGEERCLGIRDFSPRGIVSLFAGQRGWLLTNFPARDKEGEVREGVVNVASASDWLIAACHRVGYYDGALPKRGHGVWPMGQNRSAGPIAHCGNVVLVWRGDTREFEARPPGFRTADAIYPVKARVTPPQLGAALTAAAVQPLEDALALWSFERAIDRRLVAGMIGQAMIGAMTGWHAHMIVTGPRGCGKSELLHLIARALGPQAEYMARFTEAGVRQVLVDQARLACIDEAEEQSRQSAGPPLTERLIELLRVMAGGGTIAMGSQDGRGVKQQLSGNAVLAAITPPPLLPQDRSRFHTVRLKVLNVNSGAAVAKLDRAMEWLTAISPALRGRALAGWQRYVEGEAVYRDALLGLEADSRQADVLAGMLAGYDLLFHDTAISPSAATDFVSAECEQIIDALKYDNTEDSDGMQCFLHLMGAIPDVWRHKKTLTVGQMIARAMDRIDGGPCSEADKQLHTLGLRVLQEGPMPTRKDPGGWRNAIDRGQAYLGIQRSHRGLDDIYQRTRWREGGHVEALQRFHSLVRPWPIPIRCAAVQRRAIAIPHALLAEHIDFDLPDDDEAPEHDF